MVYHTHNVVNVQPEANMQVYDNSRRRTKLAGSDLLMEMQMSERIFTNEDLKQEL